MLILSFGDLFIFTLTEWTKTLVRECYLIFFQLLDFFSMLILHFFFKPGHYSSTASYEPHLITASSTESFKAESPHSISSSPQLPPMATSYQQLQQQQPTTSPPSGITGNNLPQQVFSNVGNGISRRHHKTRLSSIVESTILSNEKIALSSVGGNVTSPRGSSNSIVISSSPMDSVRSPYYIPRSKSKDYFIAAEELPRGNGSKVLSFLARLLEIILYIPQLFINQKKIPLSKMDRIQMHQKITTGFFEDLLLMLLQFIDDIGDVFRLLLRFHIVAAFWTFLKAFSLFLPSNFLSNEGVDLRSFGEIVEDLGYPYQKYQLKTEDGYYLSLDRIPRPESTRAVYFQHGIMDSSYAWVASEQHSLALQAYDAGCDVFLGNFRGSSLDLIQLQKKEFENDRMLRTVEPLAGKDGVKVFQPKKKKDYWDYTFNEHAFQDVKAFVYKIHELKTKDMEQLALLPPPNRIFAITSSDSNSSSPSTATTKTTTQNLMPPHPSFSLTAVAHSMGAGSILAYIVHQRILNQPHYLSKAILLAPAGIHKQVPLIVTYVGIPLLKLVKWLHIPLRYLGFQTRNTKIIFTKIYQDIINHPGLRSLFAFIASYSVLGGETKSNPLQYIHNMVFHSFNATAIGVWEHLAQMASSNGKFQAFDYGSPEKNMEMYQQTKPLNFLDNYGLIDIPMHIIYSKKDKIIPEECVLQHYYAMNPENVRLSRFDQIGHIELTMNQNQNIISHILDLIMSRKVDIDIKREEFYSRIADIY